MVFIFFLGRFWGWGRTSSSRIDWSCHFGPSNSSASWRRNCFWSPQWIRYEKARFSPCLVLTCWLSAYYIINLNNFEIHYSFLRIFVLENQYFWASHCFCNKMITDNRTDACSRPSCTYSIFSQKKDKNMKKIPFFMELFSADALIFSISFFPLENIKKIPSNVSHNRPQAFFHKYGQELIFHIIECRK